MIPYSRHCVTEEDVAAVVKVLKGDWLTTGPTVTAFEDAFAKRVGAVQAAAVSSGTAALHLALLAAGVGPGDEVVTSPLTFIATANAILYCGAKPVFADIEPETMNMHPEALRAAITPKTKAVIPVHFAGRPCHMYALKSIARNRLIIEDACHALGAKYRGMPVGQFDTDWTCWSFHPVKHITTGEGGMVTTPWNGSHVQKVKELRNHGRDSGGNMRALGFNYRMPDINAALGLSQLQRLDEMLALRRAFVAFYDHTLSKYDGLILPPKDSEDYQSAWHLYVIRFVNGNRDAALNFLRDRGIQATVHYPVVYLHPYYRSLGFKPGLCPAAEVVSSQILSLPLYPTMSLQQADTVVKAVGEFFEKGGRA